MILTAHRRLIVFFWQSWRIDFPPFFTCRACQHRAVPAFALLGFSLSQIKEDTPVLGGYCLSWQVRLMHPCGISVPDYPIGRDMDGGNGIAAHWSESCQKGRAVGEDGSPPVWMLEQ